MIISVHSQHEVILRPLFYFNVTIMITDLSLADASDQQLLMLIVAGESAAIAELYDRYAKILYGLLLGIVRDTDEAEDLLQEVFVQVWRRASTYQSALATPKTWLMTMTHNKGIDHLRSKRHQQKKMEVSGADDEEMPVGIGQTGDTTWQATIHGELSEHLLSALAYLPREQRVVIDLAFFQGYTHHEIAELTHIPLGTVKTRIRTGMQTLRSRLYYMADDLN